MIWLLLLACLSFALAGYTQALDLDSERPTSPLVWACGALGTVFLVLGIVTH